MKTISKLGLLSLIITLFTLSSCKNELDVNGPLTEKLAVYGLINWTDTAHYLKIYKTFLTDESIYVAAQNADNYLMYDSLEVLLIESSNGIVKYHQFDTTTAIPKDSGTFTNPAYPNKQVLYVNKDILNPTAFYALQIKNKYTGQIKATSGCFTDCSDDDQIKLPYPSTYGNSADAANPLRITPKTLISADGNGNLITNAEFKIKASVVNGYRYEAYYMFYYWEKESYASTDSVLKGPIKIDIGTTTSETGAAFQTIVIKWNPSTFFTKLKNTLPVLPANSPVIRGTGSLHLYVWAAGKEYAEFIANNNQSSLSIIEERPSISNISNGVGLFSSRYFLKMTDFELGSTTISVLLNNSNYNSLNFNY